MNIWENSSNYRSCKKKLYDIHVSRPANGTIIINKLEQHDVMQQFGGKTYFDISEQNKLRDTNPPAYQALMNFAQQGRCYVVNDNTPFVLAGTLGEMWAISADKLAQKYNFLSGNDIVAITTQSFQQRSKNGLMTWQRVRTKPDMSTAIACFVPKNTKGQIQTSWGAVLNINGDGVSHGKGDFVIAKDASLRDAYVVNGLVFANTYNNQGWVDNLDLNGAEKLGGITSGDLPIINTDKNLDCNDIEGTIRLMMSLVAEFNAKFAEVFDNIPEEVYVSNTKTAFRKYITEEMNRLKQMYFKAVDKLALSSVSKMYGLMSESLCKKYFEMYFRMVYQCFILCTACGDYGKENTDAFIKRVETIVLTQGVCRLGVLCTCDFRGDGLDISVWDSRKYFGKLHAIIGDKQSIEHSDEGVSSKSVVLNCDSFKGIVKSIACNMTKLRGIETNIKRDLFKNLKDSFCAFGVNEGYELTEDGFKFLLHLDFDMKLYSVDGETEGISYTNISNTTKTMTLSFKVDGLDISVKGRHNNVSIDKTYHVTLLNDVVFVSMLIFIDVCRSLKLHPCKVILNNPTIWKQFLIPRVENDLYIHDGYHVGLKLCGKDETKSGTKMRVKIEVWQYNDVKEMTNKICSCVIFVDFNYISFDINKSGVQRNKLRLQLNQIDPRTVSKVMVGFYMERNNEYKAEAKDFGVCALDLEGISDKLRGLIREKLYNINKNREFGDKIG